MESVFSPSPVNSHRPEEGYRQEPFDPSKRSRRRSGQAMSEFPESLPMRPNALLPAPAPLEWTGNIQEALRWAGRIRRVVFKSKPERLSLEWWHQPVERDYHIIWLADGTRWWVFREHRSHAWYLHGLFE